MKYSEFKYLLISDLYRLSGSVTATYFLKHMLVGEGFKYIFWMRTCQYTKNNIFLKFTLYPFAQIALRHFTYKLGISIPHTTQIGSGFYIGHFGGIVVNHKCIIGKNCNISHGVTLGQSNRGGNKGSPIVGD